MLLYPFRSLKFDKTLLQNFVLYGGIFLFNLLISSISGLLSFRFFQEVVLIALPVITALLITGFKNLSIAKLIDKLFIVYILAFVCFFYKELLNFPLLITSFVKALKLSTFPTESWMAFPFGMFLIYYIDQKNRIRIIISLLFFMMCFKRITFLAFFMSYGIYWFLYLFLKLEFNKRKLVIYILGLNFLLLINMYMFVNGFYSYIIKQYTGITINHLTQGRFRIYNDAIDYFSDYIVFGSSLGITNIYLSEKFKDIAFLHSDLLKLILEIGILMFIIWLVSFMIINLNTKKSIPVILYINILFISDNVFIYFDTLFLFYLILIYYNKHEKSITSQ